MIHIKNSKKQLWTINSILFFVALKEIKREAMMQLTKSTADANKPENSFLNRYRDVKPYDHTRVKLETHHDTDYINASLVRVTIISCRNCWSKRMHTDQT